MSEDDAAAPPAPAQSEPSNVFAPKQRAPRERWINPARTRATAALAAVAAIVLLGVGVLIGLAAGGGHGRDGHRFERGAGQMYGGAPGHGRGLPGNGRGADQHGGHGYGPGYGHGFGQRSTPASSTPSSSHS